MSWGRAAPGPQLGAGRLRVDAARAIAKLREYQLADRTAWILEAIRAAVAAGATAIELSGDANDIWLAWRGTPLAIADLPRLFDELVSPEPAADRHHVRLLAAGINSALGLVPAYVDVYAIDEHGAAMRVRYTPEVLDEPADAAAAPTPDDAPLRHVIAAAADAPAEAIGAGMVVHLRRRVSLQVLTYVLHDTFVHGAEPPELALARRACRDIAVPLRIRDDVYDRRTGTRDVLRIPLGDELDGFLAIVEPPAPAEAPDPGAIMEVAERGVVLAVYALDLGLGIARAPLPVRLFIDAPRMPTNASRSQVRRDRHPIAAAETRARALLATAFETLATQLAAQPIAERARTAALAVLAAAIAGPDWPSSAAALRGPVRALADLPLVRDACGTPRPVAGHWGDVVHTGKRPVDAELAPWFDRVLWVPPDDAAARLIVHTAFDPRALRRRVRWAGRQQRAQRRFFDHAARPASVEARRPPLVRMALGAALDGSCIADDVFAGLTGEICVFVDRLADPTAPANSELVLLLHGRELARAELDSPIVFAAVIDSPKLLPGDRYRGVLHDHEYDRVERALRAGVVRAVEAYAELRAGRPLPRGATVTPGPDTPPADALARMFRGAIALTRELHAPLRPPLSTAPTWPAIDGRWLALADLVGHRVIGVAPPGEHVRAPAGRLVLHLDDAARWQLARLRPAIHLVGYSAARCERAEPAALAAKMPRDGGVALAVRDGALVGAIAPGPQPIVRVRHVGVLLATRPYVSRFGPCTIDVDSDDLVPDPTWTAIVDAEPLPSYDFDHWEVALVRAAAAALVGEHDPDLVGAVSITLGHPLGRMLCRALALVAPDELLGAALAGRLRARPMFVPHGERFECSATELAARFPRLIQYLDGTAAPIAGFTPVVADQVTALALGALAGRNVSDATAELDRRQRAATRAAKLAAHLVVPAQPLALPDAGVTIPFESGTTRGLIGVGRDGFALHVWVEHRPFRVLRRSEPFPITAVVDVVAADVDRVFAEIPRALEHQLAAEIVARVPALLIAIARAQPLAITKIGPTRALIVAWLRSTAITIDDELRAALCEAVAFPTVQGGRIALAAAEDARGVLSIAAWTDSWLAADDDPASALDEPILQIADDSGELRGMLARCSRAAVVDVTDEVTKLQSTRRMARGLLPTPKVQGIAADLRRPLAELGDAGKQLGLGELGLVDGGPAHALLHVHGVLRDRMAIDVLPAVQLAIEAPDLVDVSPSSPGDALAAPGPSTIAQLAQAATIALVRAVIATPAAASLSPAIRRSLARAVLARRIDPIAVAAVRIFPTTDDRWLDWHAIEAQRAIFHDVWFVPTLADNFGFAVLASDLRPLDDRRVVLHLEAAVAADAGAHGVQMIDATQELLLDDTARRNRARPDATSLVVDADAVLAAIPLAGDGVTAPRGSIGILAPRAAARRGIRAHRAMHPFDPATDPCAWPTLAIVDDARLTPDRTWAQPALDGVWSEVVRVVRAASDAAFAAIAVPPGDALAVEALDGHTRHHHRLKLVRDSSTVLRGAVWLVPLRPRARFGARTSVEVTDPYGEREVVAAHGVAIAGRVFAIAADGWPVDAVIEEVCTELHASLLRALVARPDADPAQVVLHVAHGLALGRIKPHDTRGIQFACFEPPLDATQLVALFAARGPVTVRRPDERGDHDRDHLAVIDDGGDLASVVISCLGDRARRRGERNEVAPVPRVETRAPASPAPPAPAHPLQPLVDALRARLTAIGIRTAPWELVDRTAPIVKYDGAVQLAADNDRLQALAAAHLAHSPWAAAAIDAVAAHVITVLNLGLSEITDTSEASALGALLADA